MLKGNVVFQHSFEKTASVRLSKDMSKWKEEIYQRFTSEVKISLDKFETDIILDYFDENRGYGKGSVRVSTESKTVDFPIIIKDFKLSRFDVFAMRVGDEEEYHFATDNNVGKALFTDSFLSLSNKNSAAYASDNVIIPRGSNIKGKTKIVSFTKTAGIMANVKNEDILKFASDISNDLQTASGFAKNTGGFIGEYISDALSMTKTASPFEVNRNPLSSMRITKKSAAAIVESSIFNTDKLTPIVSGACEMRMDNIKSLGDLELMSSAAAESIKNGEPVYGIVFNISRSNLMKNHDIPSEGRIFIPMCPNKYPIASTTSSEIVDYEHWSIWGTPLPDTENVNNLIKATYPDLFKGVNLSGTSRSGNRSIIILNDDKASIIGYISSYSVSTINNRKVIKLRLSNTYNSDKIKTITLISSEVNSITRVSGSIDLGLGIDTGDHNAVFAVPSESIVMPINVQLNRYSMTNDQYIKPTSGYAQKVRENLKNQVCIMYSNGVFTIDGSCVPYEIRSSFDNVRFGDFEGIKKILETLEYSPETIQEASQTLLTRINESGGVSGRVQIFGGTTFYVSNNSNDPVIANAKKKLESIMNTFAIEANNLSVNMVKIASVIDNPTAVDVVLSLNFINMDNLSKYIDNIEAVMDAEKIIAELIVASRMGLSSIDEGATVKAAEGINSVIEGLEKVRAMVNIPK